MIVTKRMFANYLGIHRTSAKPYYDSYLEDLALKRKYLLLSDIARLDGVPLEYVAKKMGIILDVSGDFIPTTKILKRSE